MVRALRYSRCAIGEDLPDMKRFPGCEPGIIYHSLAERGPRKGKGKNKRRGEAKKVAA